MVRSSFLARLAAGFALVALAAPGHAQTATRPIPAPRGGSGSPAHLPAGMGVGAAATSQTTPVFGQRISGTTTTAGTAMGGGDRDTDDRIGASGPFGGVSRPMTGHMHHHHATTGAATNPASAGTTAGSHSPFGSSLQLSGTPAATHGPAPARAGGTTALPGHPHPIATGGHAGTHPGSATTRTPAHAHGTAPGGHTPAKPKR